MYLKRTRVAMQALLHCQLVTTTTVSKKNKLGRADATLEQVR